MGKITKIFFDTEFTGLHQKTTLISIGLVSECGKSFYAEFTDYDRLQVDDWIQTNVIDKLILQHEQRKGIEYFGIGQEDSVIGDTATVRKWLETWLKQFPQVQMWGDCISYDWVLFCQIWGHAFNIPNNIYYIPFDISTLLFKQLGDADYSRKKLAYGDTYSEYVGFKDKEHNALWDAKTIRECYKKISELEDVGYLQRLK